MDADPFGEGVRTVGGEAGEGFDAKERLFFPVSGGKVNTGFEGEIFIPQLLVESLELRVEGTRTGTAAFGRGTRGPARPGIGRAMRGGSVGLGFDWFHLRQTGFASVG